VAAARNLHEKSYAVNETKRTAERMHFPSRKRGEILRENEREVNRHLTV
jgi:hypothetical protein